MSEPFVFHKLRESEIEDAILTYLNYQIGCFAFKVETKASYDPVRKKYLTLNKNVVPGTPDILCCLNINSIGVFIGFEVKTKTGKQSVEQKAFAEKVIRKSSGFYFLVRSVADAERAIAQVKAHVTAARTPKAASLPPRSPA